MGPVVVFPLNSTYVSLLDTHTEPPVVSHAHKTHSKAFFPPFFRVWLLALQRDLISMPRHFPNSNVQDNFNKLFYSFKVWLCFFYLLLPHPPIRIHANEANCQTQPPFMSIKLHSVLARLRAVLCMTLHDSLLSCALAGLVLLVACASMKTFYYWTLLKRGHAISR